MVKTKMILLEEPSLDRLQQVVNEFINDPWIEVISVSVENHLDERSLTKYYAAVTFLYDDQPSKDILDVPAASDNYST